MNQQQQQQAVAAANATDAAAAAARLAARQTKDEYAEKAKMYEQAVINVFGQVEGKSQGENLYFEQDARAGDWWILQPTCYCYTQLGKPERQIPDSYRCICLATQLEMTPKGLRMKANTTPAMMLGGTPGHWFTLLNKCCTTDEQVTAVAKYFSNSSMKSPLVRLMTAPASNVNIKFCERGPARNMVEVMLGGILAVGRTDLEDRLQHIQLPPVIFYSLGKMGVADKDRYDDRTISVVTALAKGMITAADVRVLLNPTEQIATVRAFLDTLYERSLQRPIVVAQDITDIQSALEQKGVGACAKVDLVEALNREVLLMKEPSASASWYQLSAPIPKSTIPAITDGAGAGAPRASIVEDDAEAEAEAAEISPAQVVKRARV